MNVGAVLVDQDGPFSWEDANMKGQTRLFIHDLRGFEPEYVTSMTLALSPGEVIQIVLKAL